MLSIECDVEKPQSVNRRAFLGKASAAMTTGLAFYFGHSVKAEAAQTSEPNDYWFESQRPMFEKMHVLEAFAFEDGLQKEGRFRNLAPVRIGFIDYSGIIRIQEEFPSVPGWDVANQQPIPEEGIYESSNPNKEPFYHATQVASIAISKVNNGEGIAGLCGRIPITVRQVKFLKNVEGRIRVQNELLMDCLKYFTIPENFVDVINVTSSGVDSSALADVVGRLNEMRTVIVASAGNSSSDQVMHPAAYPNVISVGAIRLVDNEKDERSSFGKVDMAGYTGVYALIPNEERRSRLSIFGITSAAAPQVSSLAVHLKFLKRELTPANVKEIMQNTGTPVAGTYNWKLPNYLNAIQHVMKAA